MQENGQDRGERSRRTFTIEDYRRALAKLDALRATEAPGLRVELAAAVTADAELAPVSMVVRRGPHPARRATVVGLAPPPVIGDRWAATAAVLRELAAPSEPVTERVLRAVGLGPRPSGRAREQQAVKTRAVAVRTIDRSPPRRLCRVAGGAANVRSASAVRFPESISPAAHATFRSGAGKLLARHVCMLLAEVGRSAGLLGDRLALVFRNLLGFVTAQSMRPVQASRRRSSCAKEAFAMSSHQFANEGRAPEVPQFAAAGDVLAHFGVSSPPVDVLSIAFWSGAQVLAATSPDWDGAIDMGPPPIIYVDANVARVRQRFTIAHELGHYFLHRHKKQAFRDRFSSQGLDPYEIEANRFAADLLMPASWVKAYAQYEKTAQLAQRFDVSQQAMSIRLEALGRSVR